MSVRDHIGVRSRRNDVKTSQEVSGLNELSASDGPHAADGRIFFKFDLEFTYFAHAIATRLKREHGLADHQLRGIVDGRLYMDFLRKRQRDIRYQELASNQDMLWRARTEPPDMSLLEQMERELGVDTLWRLFDAERFIKHYSYRQVLSAMTLFLGYYWQEFTDHRPSVVIGFATATMYSLACFFVARRLGIPYLELGGTKINLRGIIAGPTFLEFPDVDERYRELLNEQGGNDEIFARATAFIDGYRKRPEMPDGTQRWFDVMGGRTSLHPRRLVGLARITWWYYFGPYRRDVEQEHPFRQVIDRMFAFVRRQALLRGPMHERSLPIGERYAYFALHLQPEMTTMILAPFWQDQVGLIENIARSLPIGLRLYVKEHIPMLGLRPLGYYERLKRIPNVRLVDPFMSSLELVRNAQLVLTITGTVGWEALLLGRPVITFGDVFYNVLDCVRKCKNVEDLPQLTRDCLDHSPHDERQVVTYVAALIERSFDFDLDKLSFPTRSYGDIRDSDEAAVMYREYEGAMRRLGIFGGTPKRTAD